MTRTWTLKGRFTRWLVIGICAQALLMTVPAVVFLRSSLDRELSALLEEELAEFSDDFNAALGKAGADPIASFQAIAVELSMEHRENPLAWGLWDGQQLVGQAGSPELFAAVAPFPAALDQRGDAGERVVWRATQLSSGEVVAVVVDGSVQFDVLRRFGYVVGLLILLGIAVALGVGVIFAGRISSLLGEVAQHARRVGQAGDAEHEPLALDELPEEVRSVAQALQTATDQLRDETRQLRMMTAGLAHELRSPIQNLIGEIEVTLMSERDGERYREVLLSNLDEVRELGAAVHNLMLLCTEQGGKSSVPPEVFDLGFEAGLRLAGERSQAERKGVDFTLELVGDVSLCADREALLRMLRNLVANAIGWTPAGGHVTARIEGRDEELLVTVDDSGPGVPEELRDVIFEPFYRGPSQDGKRAGYGLGLAIARAAILAQGGCIAIDDGIHGGARFQAHVPRTPLEPGRSQPSASARSSSGHSTSPT